MKFTNKHNLPEAVVRLVSAKNYDKGEGQFSVTELLSPPQLNSLKKKYWDSLEEDVMDRTWSVLGSAVHHMLDQASSDETLTEQRMYVEIDGVKIGGQVDHYEDGLIMDFKITSAWTLVYRSRIDEWTEQLNMYAHIFRENGYPVKKLQVFAVLRDWDKHRAKQSKEYPQAPMQIVPLKLWTDDEVVQLLHERVAAHLKEVPAPCTPEEMWEQPTKYAVMKPGGKRAVRVFDALNAADDYILQNSLAADVQERPGVRTRCEEYCPVKDFCPQYKAYKESLDE